MMKDCDKLLIKSEHDTKINQQLKPKCKKRESSKYLTPSSIWMALVSLQNP
jgi:hypothetical protein